MFSVQLNLIFEKKRKHFKRKLEEISDNQALVYCFCEQVSLVTAGKSGESGRPA